MKKIALSLYLVLCCLSVWGQSTELRAKVVDLKTQQPLANATATIVNTNLSATTDLDGLFILADPPTGNQVLLIGLTGYLHKSSTLESSTFGDSDRGTSFMKEDITEEQPLCVITLT